MAGAGITTRTGLLTANHLLKQRYLILNQIGKGGMGAVYKAEDTLFHNRLEMSQSGLNQQEVAEAMDGFKREAHMLANLDHQSLPKIYDYFNDAGRWYLVMDFIAGETLEYYLFYLTWVARFGMLASRFSCFPLFSELFIPSCESALSS